MSVLDDFLKKKYGQDTRSIDNPMVDPGIVGVAPVQFLRRNGNRVGFTIVNLSANNVYLAFDAGVGAARGILLDPAGGQASLWIEEDGELAQKEVWLVAAGADSAVYVNEVEVM